MIWLSPLLVLVVMGIGLSVGWCIWVVKRKRFLKKRAEINATLMQTVKNHGLNIDKVFVIDDHQTFDKKDPSIKPQFLIDMTAKIMIFVDYDKPLTVVVGFEEFLNYEIYENGSMAFSGGAVGGLLAGGFWGESVGKCNNLRLIIRLKRYDCPQMVYDIIAKTPMNLGIVKTSRAYQTCVSSMQELASFFEVIKYETNSETK